MSAPGGGLCSVIGSLWQYCGSEAGSPTERPANRQLSSSPAINSRGAYMHVVCVVASLSFPSSKLPAVGHSAKIFLLMALPYYHGLASPLLCDFIVLSSLSSVQIHPMSRSRLLPSSEPPWLTFVPWCIELPDHAPLPAPSQCCLRKTVGDIPIMASF